MRGSGKAQAKTALWARVREADGTWREPVLVSIDGKPATLPRRMWRKVRLLIKRGR